MSSLIADIRYHNRSPRKIESVIITPSNISGLSRRAFLRLGGGTALSLVGNGLSWAAEPFDRARFIELSANLLQVDTGTLDEGVAGDFLSGLLADGKDDALKTLADGKPDPLLEQQIVAGWYSGVQRTASGENLVSYTDALMWEAMDYTKPQGWCGGETGYWALPPSEN